MIRRPIHLTRPDLRQEVVALIGSINDARPEGEHRVPVLELLRLLGVRTRSALQEQLRLRGDLVFEGATFKNHGPPVQRRIRLMGFDVELLVGPDLGGTIERQADGFTLHFDRDRSIEATKFLFHIELRSLAMSHGKIKIDFRGGAPIEIAL